MNPEEAAEYNIAEDTRDLFIRVETGKAQYARRQSTRWLSIEEVELANGDATHRLTPWSAPNASITPEMIARAIEAVRAGRAGQPLSFTNKSEASFRRAFSDVGIPSALHTRLLDNLLATGTVAYRAWRDPEDRKIRKRLWAPGSAFTGWVTDDAHDNSSTATSAP